MICPWIYPAPPSTQGGIEKRKKLKDELTNQLVGLSENGTFDRVVVLKKVGQHMNIVWYQYRVLLERNPRYEHPLMFPAREWKSLVEDGKERDLRK